MNLAGASIVLGLIVVASVSWYVAGGMLVLAIGYWLWTRPSKPSDPP